MLKAPFRWPGGKTNLRGRLLPLLPGHLQYIEPYFGAGAVFFAKQPAPIETVNDLDGGIAGFFTTLRDAPEELERLACLTEYSRALYDDCNATWRAEPDPVRRAWKWWVVANQSRGGAFGGGWGYEVISTYPSAERNLGRCVGQALNNTGRFASVAARLLEVQIENRPALDVLRRFCRPDSLAYLDPPYAPDACRATAAYEHTMTAEDHAELVDALLALPGRFLLSGYPTPLYAPLEDAGWARVDFTTTCLLSGCRTGQAAIRAHAKRTESVWLDPQTAAEKLPALQSTLALDSVAG